MKPWSVIRISTDLLDMMPGRGDLGFIAWAAVEEASHRPHAFDGSHSIYFVDEEIQADRLAAMLAAKRPGTHWVVAKSTSSFRCPAGPAAKAVFTDRGLMPAV